MDSQKGEKKKDKEGLELWTRNQFQFGIKSIQIEKMMKRTTSQKLEADHLAWTPFHTCQNRQRAAPKNIQLPVLAYKGIYEIFPIIFLKVIIRKKVIPELLYCCAI